MKNLPSSRFLPCAALLMAGLLGMTSARAHGDTELLTSDLQAAPGSAGVGIVGRTETSPYQGGGTRLDLMPLYLYEGERFFLHGNRGGVKLLEGGDQRVDALLEQRLEGPRPNHRPASLNGMALRETGIDAGLSYRYRQPWGTLQADLLHDVAGASRGSELRLAYSYDWRSGAWTLRPSVSLALRNARLNNYYYGVLPGEASPGRPAYAPGAGVNTTLGLNASYALSQRWRLLAGASATVLGGQVADSPIVQKRVLPAVYLGAAYDFGAPQRLRNQDGQDGTPTYFKLLYGKATEDGCHLVKIITARCLSTASVNPTSISGVQVGKPFIENFNGWPIDLVGYVGLTHHNDRGLQRNGMQFDVFMKGIYSGFPWSERVKTRLGLGVGVSFAQRAPYIEASSAVINGKPSSRVLQYLDPTLDVSLGDLVGVHALKQTYVGIGVSHRSGIFGASRMFGNANGGSNYIYTYVETAY